MKLVEDIKELKKGDTIIIVNNKSFESRGFRRISGDIYNIELGRENFQIKCIETNTIEEVILEKSKIFLIG